MIKFLAISFCVSGAARLYLGNKDIKSKNLASLIAGFSITSILEFIQFVIGGILCLIF